MKPFVQFQAETFALVLQVVVIPRQMSKISTLTACDICWHFVGTT
jgi:hypothetical protein